jgi:hypothetical protein
MPPLRIYPSKRKLLLYLLAMAALAVAAALLVQDADGSEKAVLIAALVFAPVLAIFVAVKLISNKPTLEIDSLGIVDRSSMTPAGRVPWQQIRSVHVHVLNGRRFIGVEPVDRQAFLAHEGVGRKLMRRTAGSKLDGFPLIAIPEQTVSVGLETLIQEMARFNPYLVVLPEQRTGS